MVAWAESWGTDPPIATVRRSAGNPLAGSNVPQRSAGLDPFVVEREALHEQFAEPPRGPLPELRAPRRTRAVTEGENGVEVVVVDESPDLAGAFWLNC